MVTVSDYGSWKSNIDTDLITSGNCKQICELQAHNESVYWIEQTFPLGKRIIYESRNGDKPIQWTSSETSVRNDVHGYGGGSFIVVDGAIVYITQNGIYKQKSPESNPQIIFEDGVSRRFADPFHFQNHLYLIEEVHTDQCQHPQNRISRISLNGGEIEPLVSGADFYAWPRVSPDGRYFSWMQWNLPHMPWDETSIEVVKFDVNDDGKTKRLNDRIVELSMKDVNFHAPQWSPQSQLHLICDRTNWWNVYSVDLEQKQLNENVYETQFEIGAPQWQFCDRHYAMNQHGILMNVSGKLVFKWWNGTLEHIETPLYTEFRSLDLNNQNIGYCIASGPRRSSSVIRIDIQSKKITVIRESRDAKEIDKLDISIPTLVKFPSGDWTVSGWFYPPFSSSYKAAEGTLPPVVLFAHAGPTGAATESLNMKTQYFTSRGFAVFDVNYRGSTGFGTEFRNSLRKQWGLVDRDDMINAAQYLVDNAFVNKDRICMMGSSASGYLLLATIQNSSLIKAASSLYGVCDLIALTKDTHKFELGYNDQLIGKYPEEEHIYKQRSPVNKIDQINCPIVFFHGDRDTVVPLSQSITLHDALKAKGIPTLLVVFPDEGHGFRGTPAIRDSLRLTYAFFRRVLGIEEVFTKNEIKIDNLD